MNILEGAIEYAKSKGFTGLYHDDDCCCTFENMCDDPCMECEFSLVNDDGMENEQV